jgi:hypothetical protein
MTASLPPFVQDNGVPFDMFIQVLTEQLDKAQASMAVKARIAKMPMTFAVKDVSLDLKAFVSVVDDDIYIRPARPGDSEASTLKLSLTTITKSMIEENAVDFTAEDPKFALKQALGDTISEDEQRKLERIGVRTITQLDDLRKSAGADVIARLSRMPVTRLQQALIRAAAPRIVTVESRTRGEALTPSLPAEQKQTRVHLRGANLLQEGRLPVVRVMGQEIPIVLAQEHELVIVPLESQLGQDAEVDFGNGETLTVHMGADVGTGERP